MTPEAFVCWLQGFFELSGATSLDEQQTLKVRGHLDALLSQKSAPVARGGAGMPDDVIAMLDSIESLDLELPLPAPPRPVSPYFVPSGPPVVKRLEVVCTADGTLLSAPDSTGRPY